MKKVTIKVKEHKPPEDIVRLLQKGTRIQFTRYNGEDAMEARLLFALLNDIREKGIDIPLNDTNFRIIIKDVTIYTRPLIDACREEIKIIVAGELI